MGLNYQEQDAVTDRSDVTNPPQCLKYPTLMVVGGTRDNELMNRILLLEHKCEHLELTIDRILTLIGR